MIYNAGVTSAAQPHEANAQYRGPEKPNMARRAQKSAPRRGPGKIHAQARDKPLTLESLQEHGALRGFKAPESDFDPAGEWCHLYRLWLVGSHLNRYRGFIEIRRAAPNGDGAVDLAVHRELLLSHHPAVHRTTATMRCAADALCTPRSWTIEAETFDARMKPIALSRVAESGVVKGKTVEVSRGERRYKRPLPTPFTSDFSLFDAVQRLGGAKTQPMTFALLQDLDEIKEGQRLSYRQTVDFDVGGKSLTLRCYQQIGRGILPYRYYVDPRGRLLFAVSGIRAYILDPNVRAQHERAVSLLARRSK